MIKAIFGFGLQRGKTMTAYRRSFAEWRVPLIFSNSIAPVGLSLLWAVKPAIPPGVGQPRFLPYAGLTLNWFESSEDLAGYAETPLFDTLARHGMEWLSSAHGYLVEEVVQWAAPGAVPDAEVVPGFKVITGVRRKPGMSQGAFEKHYREVHAPLAREHHPAMIGYTQNFVRSPLMTDSPPLDAIVEMQFRDRRDFNRRFYASKESEAIIWQDVVQFLDPAATQILTVEEQVFKKPAS